MGFLKDLNWRDFSVLDVVEGCASYASIALDVESKTTNTELYRSRMDICHVCQINVGGVCSMQRKIQHVNGQWVTGCGCNLKCKCALGRASCPAGKW